MRGEAQGRGIRLRLNGSEHARKKLTEKFTLGGYLERSNLREAKAPQKQGCWKDWKGERMGIGVHEWRIQFRNLEGWKLLYVETSKVFQGLLIRGRTYGNPFKLRYRSAGQGMNRRNLCGGVKAGRGGGL